MPLDDEVMLGRFWRVGTPLPERRGELQVSPGKEAELRVERPIVIRRCGSVSTIPAGGLT